MRSRTTRIVSSTVTNQNSEDNCRGTVQTGVRFLTLCFTMNEFPYLCRCPGSVLFTPLCVYILIGSDVLIFNRIRGSSPCGSLLFMHTRLRTAFNPRSINAS